MNFLNIVFIVPILYVNFANADVYDQLDRIAPHLSQREKLSLATDIVEVCEKTKINCRIFTAILAQESMFRTDAFNKRSNDHGIGQINSKTAASMGFCESRLKSDRKYSLEAAAEVLGYFQRRYGAKESQWYCRFNVGTRSLEGNLGSACARYVKAVKRFL